MVAVVTPTNLHTDFDIGVAVANKISITQATAAAAGKVALATAAGGPSTSDTTAATPAYVNAAIASLPPATVPTATDTVQGVSSLNLGMAPNDDTNATDALTTSGFNALANNGGAPNAVQNSIMDNAVESSPVPTRTQSGTLWQNTSAATLNAVPSGAVGVRLGGGYYPMFNIGGARANRRDATVGLVIPDGSYANLQATQTQNDPYGRWVNSFTYYADETAHRVITAQVRILTTIDVPGSRLSYEGNITYFPPSSAPVLLAEVGPFHIENAQASETLALSLATAAPIFAGGQIQVLVRASYGVGNPVHRIQPASEITITTTGVAQ